MKNLLTLSCAFLFILSSSIAQRNTAKRQSKPVQVGNFSASIDSLIQTTSPRKFNGVILITQHGKTLYSKAYGYADMELKTAMDINNSFRIQSNSKQITAALILQEVDRGNIKLSDFIRMYIPDLKQPWADSITVHQLLNMSSGIVNIDMPLSFRPGTGFHYSNPAYGLLGKIIEKSTGKSYNEMANTLFRKLGMNNTYCYEPDGINKNFSEGYWLSDSDTKKVDFKSLNFTKESWANFLPAGGIISTAADLNVWDTKLHSGQILQPKSYELMINSTVVDADFTFSHQPSNYGYGVNINEGLPAKYIGHAGRGLGFVSLKLFVPAKKVDIIIMENIYHRDVNIVYHFEKKIREIVLNSDLLKN